MASGKQLPSSSRQLHKPQFKTSDSTGAVSTKEPYTWRQACLWKGTTGTGYFHVTHLAWCSLLPQPKDSAGFRNQILRFGLLTLNAK